MPWFPSATVWECSNDGDSTNKEIVSGEFMIPRHLLIAVAALLLLVVSMGIYLRHMRRRAAEGDSSAADTLPVAPPPSGPMQGVTLYVADDGAGVLRTQAAQIPVAGGRQQRA